MLDRSLLSQNIISLLGLGSLNADRQTALVEKIMELVEKRITLRMLDGLKEEQLNLANTVFASGTDEEKTAFIMALPNLQQILEEEIINVKQELLQDAQKLVE